MAAESTSLSETPTPQEQVKKSGGFYVPALDWLRCVAFLMVFVPHAIPWNLDGLDRLSPLLGEIWRNGIRTGAYGVTLFFCLSSFLITTLLLEERTEKGSINVPYFYLRRVLRIWPLYFLVLILGFGLEPILEPHKHLPMWAFWRFATFNANFVQAAGLQTPISISILWSVCVEEQFYVIWPLIIKFCKRDEPIIVCSIIAILIGIGSRIWLGYNGQPWTTVWFYSFCQIDCFGFGALGAVIYSRQKFNLSKKAAGAILVGCFLGILLIGTTHPVIGLKIDTPVSLTTAFLYTGVTLLSAVIVFVTASVPLPFTTKPFAVRTGKLTYGLYCFHALVLLALPLVIRGDHMAPMVLRVLVGLVVSYALAYTSYNYYEKRFLRIKRSYQIVRSGSTS